MCELAVYAIIAEAVCQVLCAQLILLELSDYKRLGLKVYWGDEIEAINAAWRERKWL